MEKERIDVFEEYYPFVDRDVTTDKELLMKRFEQFLSNPESTGCFIVRWKENEDNYNREDLWEYVEQCRQNNTDTQPVGRDDSPGLFILPVVAEQPQPGGAEPGSYLLACRLRLATLRPAAKTQPQFGNTAPGG